MNSNDDPIPYKGYVIRIEPDPDPQNPRDWDNVGTMACWHGRYTLGDVQPAEPPLVYRVLLPKSEIILPLYLYDHSGLTMNTTGFSCPWDSGQVGWIHVSAEKAKRKFASSRYWRRAALKCLQSEVETYDKYLRGGFVGYVVEDDRENHIDSCWGIDDPKHALQCAKDAVDAEFRRIEQHKYDNIPALPGMETMIT